MIRRPVGANQTELGPDGLPQAPSATRNQAAILEVLLPALPASGVVLELASGTGQHIAALAAHRADLSFHPSDIDADRRAVVDRRCEGLPNVGPARVLDACAPGWAEGIACEVVFTVNLLHLISDAEMAILLDEAAGAVTPGGLLAIYGPFLRADAEPTEGDLRFDAALRADDPSVGLKEAEVLETVLDVLGFAVERAEMPANNLMLLARKGGVPGL